VFIKAFGSYLPERVVGNDEIGAQVGCEPSWIVNVSGIEERRFAEPDQTVADLAVCAAQDCLKRAGTKASELDMIIVSSGSCERQFPGPASTVASRLGLHSTPAIDVPVASAGSLIGLSLASRIGGNVLVVAAEKMSSVVLRQPMERGVAILFGDGAGACLVAANGGPAKILDSALHSDGAYAEDLKLGFDSPLAMNGRIVIMQASRKIPRVIEEVLTRNSRSPADVDVFVMHQANQNLIDRVAQALSVPAAKFFSNIRRYGNTSSASMLIAAAEWEQQFGFRHGVDVCFAAFGAGFQWGALLAEGV
jgi:3-oxoacyl-[acyl-carrier-protein] synthase-3